MKYCLKVLFFLASLYILAACSPSATTSPTPDIHAPVEFPSTATPPEADASVESPHQGADTVAPPFWTASLTGAVNVTPALSGDLIIIATADGTIHARRAATGEAAWQFAPQTKIWDASLRADGTRVCIGMQGGQVTCLDAATGQPLWTADLDLEVQSRLSLTSDRVYAPTTHVGTGLTNDYEGQAVLFALDAATGETVWEAVTDNYILRRPIAVGEMVITGGLYLHTEEETRTRIYAFNAADGSEIWRYESNDGLVRWLETSGDTLLFSAHTETVYGLDLATGQLAWSFGPSYWMQFPAQQDGTIYFGTGDHFFQALNAATGERIWEQEINIDSLNQIGRPILQDNLVVFNAVTGEIYGLDMATGEHILYFDTGHTSRVGGALFENYYIMGDPDGNLYAYKIR